MVNDAQAQPQKHSQTKGESEKPSNRWRPIISGAFHDLHSYSWLQNLLIGLALLLIWPLIGAFVMNTQRGIIIGFGFGATIFVWIGVAILLRQTNTPPIQATPVQANTPMPGMNRREQPTFRTNPKFVRLVLGGNVQTIDIAKLNKKFSPAEMAGTEPIHLYIEDGVVLADIVLNADWPGDPIEIKHNEYDNIPPGWDVNSNQYALEIVDNDIRPIFQLIYKQPNELTINGVFRFQTGTVVLSNTGSHVGGPAEAIPYERITRIFKYPSALHPGEYEGNPN